MEALLSSLGKDCHLCARWEAGTSYLWNLTSTPFSGLLGRRGAVGLQLLGVG